MLVSPSLLAADFLNLEKELERVSNADMLHLDVMDGTFVPNMSFGFSIIDSLAPVCAVPLDVHLMTVHPERWFERLRNDGASMVSFHLEAAQGNAPGFVRNIQEMGMKAGIAINPDMPVESLFPYIGKADFFLVMSVFAGFGGQKFIDGTLERVKKLKTEILMSGSNTLIEVDGGVNAVNARDLDAAGADILVAGSSVFKSDDPAKAIDTLKLL